MHGAEELDILDRFSASLDKKDNFYDFLFAFLNINSILKKGSTLKRK